ncbi:MAG: alpha-ketoglutarate-dependent dioxygenase AlkB [Bacteroidota bacterium]
MKLSDTIFTYHSLSEKQGIYLSQKVDPFSITEAHTEAIWNLHPEEFHELHIHGRKVKTPRWQQAYGRNYQYSGSRNNALPIPTSMKPFMDWCQQHIDHSLNGMLLNWYDGASSHYIGAHRDDVRDLVVNSPIVTISLGEERKFRMRPYKEEGFHDFTICHGDVLVIPWETNLRWTHEVPSFKKYQGKRISVTLRAFK